MKGFADGQRIPNFKSVMGKARHEERRPEQQQVGTGRKFIAGEDFLLELETRHFAEQPAPQRPGSVILAAKGKYRCGHSRSSATALRPDAVSLGRRLRS